MAEPAAHEPADHELMERIATGDREALAALVQRHQRRVHHLALRFLGRPDLAEDVAQSVFLRIYRRAGDYEPSARFTTWLYRVTANLCWDVRRRAARGPQPLSDANPAADAGHPPVEQAERAERVRAAVSELPDRQRLAVVLHRFEGLSHREIADVTGWSTSAVESCLVRAYEKLRASLSDLVDS